MGGGPSPAARTTRSVSDRERPRSGWRRPRSVGLPQRRTRRRCSARVPPPAISAASPRSRRPARAASRSPVKISGAAIGTSSPNEHLPPLIPMPRAASTVSGSTCWIPTYVLIKITGIPSSVERHDRRREPERRGRRHFTASRNMIDRIASDGTARPSWRTAPSRTAPRRVWPTRARAGSRSAIAIARAISDSWTCSHTRIGMPSDPDQCAGSHEPPQPLEEPFTSPTALVRLPPWPTASPALKPEQRAGRRANASATDSTTPTISGVQKNSFKPFRMNWPNPPRPISAAIVTSPIEDTVAMRSRR